MINGTTGTIRRPSDTVLNRANVAKHAAPLLIGSLFMALGCTKKSAKPVGDYSSTIKTVGIKAESNSQTTTWKIPWAETHEKDKKELFDLAVSDFRKKLDSVNRKFAASKKRAIVEEDEVENKLAKREEIVSSIEKVIQSVRGDKNSTNRFQAALEGGYTQKYGRIDELSSGKSYVIPQAFMAVITGKVGVDIVVGGELSGSLLWLFQPYVTVTIRNADNKIVDKGFDVQSEIFVVPNFGLGVGASAQVTTGVGFGAVFGPLKSTKDIAGSGIGISGSGVFPFVGGVNGQFMLIWKYPPLYYVSSQVMLGAGGGLGVHANLQRIISVEDFLAEARKQ